MLALPMPVTLVVELAVTRAALDADIYMIVVPEAKAIVVPEAKAIVVPQATAIVVEEEEVVGVLQKPLLKGAVFLTPLGVAVTEPRAHFYTRYMQRHANELPGYWTGDDGGWLE